MTTVPSRVTVYYFHPFTRRSIVNRALKEAVESLEGIRFRDMYEIYPEFSIDVENEKGILLETDIAVFQHPFYWYNCPSLMKEWLDAVLEWGWAYGPGGNHLKGKHWIQAITTGGAVESYGGSGSNHFTILELLRPFEQSARLCGMHTLRPFVTHGTRSMPRGELEHQIHSYRELLRGLQRRDLPPRYSTFEAQF